MHIMGHLNSNEIIKRGREIYLNYIFNLSSDLLAVQDRQSINQSEALCLRLTIWIRLFKRHLVFGIIGQEKGAAQYSQNYSDIQTHHYKLEILWKVWTNEKDMKKKNEKRTSSFDCSIQSIHNDWTARERE